MADFVGMHCDIHPATVEDVKRLPVGGKEVDLCPKCWHDHGIDVLLGKGRDVPEPAAKARTPRSSARKLPEETRKIKEWAALNKIGWSPGPVPNELREAYAANNPYMVNHRYEGDGNAPEVGKLPDEQPAGTVHELRQRDQ